MTCVASMIKITVDFLSVFNGSLLRAWRVMYSNASCRKRRTKLRKLQLCKYTTPRRSSLSVLDPLFWFVLGVILIVDQRRGCSCPEDSVEECVGVRSGRVKKGKKTEENPTKKKKIIKVCIDTLSSPFVHGVEMSL
ncbi:hypothetical protein F7725_001356 [Dissostichus mawsoni]|uniref:Uncharacterized protein n=1 Tax=Dissostichus mawsoni TaxID=36200 RepID=A0A7J5ZJ48_DISMA|nr:hypothetical protein F7725_001356 [Dissostichus mawsoni]